MAVKSARQLSERPATPDKNRIKAPAEKTPPESKAALGKRLKLFRVGLQLSLQQLSERCQIARSTISKIENGQLSPTFDLLQKLARGLDLDLAQLFNNESEQAPVGRRSVTRARTGPIVETKEYVYEALSADLTRKQIFPLRTIIRARTLEEFGGWVRHEGEEFLYVLNGEVCVYTEFYEPTPLKPGDSIYIDSRMGHAVVSMSTDFAEVLWVCTQVSLD